MRRLEQAGERLLWGARLMILVAVAAGIFVALAALCMATVDVVHLLRETFRYVTAAHGDDHSLKVQIVTGIVKAVDGYLLTAIMLIFSLGLYELFISKIDAAEHSEVAGRVLLIRSLDDLKDRLAKVVILILVIEFFQQALEMSYKTPRDLVFLALGTALVGGALYLSGRKSAH